MLATDLEARIAKLFTELDRAQPLIEGIKTFAKVSDGLVSPHLQNIAAGGKDLGSYGPAAHNYLAAAHTTLSRVRSRALYDALKIATRALNDFARDAPEVAGQSAVDLATLLDAFGHLYETYVHDTSGVNALTAILAAKTVLTELTAFRLTLDGVRVVLQTPQVIDEDEEPYAAYFPGGQSLEDVAARLRAIEEIFQRLADLIVPERHAPAARILRIESGSLLVVLAVAKSVLSVARPWIAALAGFYYRNNVPEGSLKHSPELAKQAIKKTLDVKKMLKDAGVNTDGMDVPLEEAGTALAERVAVLVKNQHRIRLGDEEFDSAIRQALPSPERKRLPLAGAPGLPPAGEK